MMRGLVITSDSASSTASARDIGNSGGWPGLEGGPAATRQQALDSIAAKHNRLVVAGVRAVRERWGRGFFDLAFFSCVHGLVPPNGVLALEEDGWDPAKDWSLSAAASRPPFLDQIAALVSTYDLVIYLLSGHSLAMLRLPLPVPESVRQIALTDEESLGTIPVAGNLSAVVADGPRAAQRWHVKAGHVRGFLFGRLCQRIVEHGPVVLEWLRLEPWDIEQLFYKRTRWRPQFPLW